MERIGVRQLRQEASRWLARVASGESFEVTDRGRLVAVLTPPRGASIRERLIGEGRLLPARANLRSVAPLRPGRSHPSLARELSRLRDEER